MTKGEFIYLFLEQYRTGLIIWALYVPTMLLIFKKQIYSFFDPMFMFLLMGFSAHVVILFLFLFSYIDTYYFINFIFTELAFSLGWLICRHININKIIKRNLVFSPVSIYLYLISFILFLLSQISIYYVKGIPLFMEHRLELLKGGDGFGFFGRVLYVTSIVSVTIAIYRVLYTKKSMLPSLFDWFVVAFYFITQVLSGSKSGVLNIVFIYSAVTLYANKINVEYTAEVHVERIMKLIFLTSIPIGLSVIYLQNGAQGDVYQLFTTLFMRFLNTGDIYYLSWVNNMISYINTDWKDGILALLSDPLGALRVMSRDELPIHLGLQVAWLVNNSDNIDGPNLRHNVFGLAYFGFYFSILYSFMLGFLTGFIRNILFHRLKANIISLSFYCLLFQTSVFIAQDFSSLAVSYFFSILIIFPMLIFLSVVFSSASKTKKIVINNV